MYVLPVFVQTLRFVSTGQIQSRQGSSDSQQIFMFPLWMTNPMLNNGNWKSCVRFSWPLMNNDNW